MPKKEDKFPERFKFGQTTDKHYESEFKSELWQMIKRRAEEKDISYCDAYTEIMPEWYKLVRYRDTEYEDKLIQARNKELAELREIENQIGWGGVKCL
jgi:hypothetical protein